MEYIVLYEFPDRPNRALIVRALDAEDAMQNALILLPNQITFPPLPAGKAVEISVGKLERKQKVLQ